MDEKTKRLIAADDPLTELFAELWHEEERRAAGGSGRRNPWTLATNDERKTAYERAALVLAGEVKWSECSAGDRAIWNGRGRSLLAWHRARPTLRVFPVGVHEIVPWHYYDTMHVSAKADTFHRFFGNENIGNTRLTNMWVAGQTMSEEVLVISDLFVTVRGVYSADVRTEALRYLENAALYLVVGEKRMTPDLCLADLIAERSPVDTLIPERQTFEVKMQPFKKVTMSQTEFDVVVHLDGGRIRPLQ